MGLFKIWVTTIFFMFICVDWAISQSNSGESVSLTEKNNQASSFIDNSKNDAAYAQFLLKKVETQDMKLQQQRKIIGGFSVVCMLLVLLSGVLYLQYSIKQRDADYILEQNRLIVEKNHEILYQQQQILTQKEQLRKLNRAKDRMFSIISHDLRMPFLSLQSLLSLLDAGVLAPNQIQALTAKVRQSTISASATLDNLLQWGTTQIKGDIANNPKILQVNGILEEVLSLYQLQITEKNIFIENQVSEDVQLFADAEHIRIILRNLIGNAIKFTPKGGEVKVYCKVHPKTVEIHIEDTGVGLSELQIAQLFKIPTHFSSLGTQKEKGAGLGLLLCKEFAESNEGCIYVRSELDKGSIFTLVLPHHTPIFQAQIA